MNDSYALNINNHAINSENFLKLLGIEIDNILSFGKRLENFLEKEQAIN